MKIIECPRDAMQGLHEFVPTHDKLRYLKALLKVGFDTIDFGSFVSPKAIPQMRDTAEITEQLKEVSSESKLLAIVANERGAEDATRFDCIDYLGFPLSVSETFQQRNTKKSISEAKETLYHIQEIAQKANQEVVTYLSMGFGNPYGDPYSPTLVSDFAGELFERGFKFISLADTIGTANPENIGALFSEVISALPQAEIGAHLHTTAQTALEKVKAAYEAGARRMDGAIGGMGGCPMAKDDLIGNMPTETIIGYFTEMGIGLGLDFDALAKAGAIKQELFG